MSSEVLAKSDPSKTYSSYVMAEITKFHHDSKASNQFQVHSPPVQSPYCTKFGLNTLIPLFVVIVALPYHVPLYLSYLPS